MEWSTKDEMEFIDGIGQEKNHKPTNRPEITNHNYGEFDRSELLGKYIDICASRHDWGKMNKTDIIEYAKEVRRHA